VPFDVQSMVDMTSSMMKRYNDIILKKVLEAVETTAAYHHIVDAIRFTAIRSLSAFVEQDEYSFQAILKTNLPKYMHKMSLHCIESDTAFSPSNRDLCGQEYLRILFQLHDSRNISTSMRRTPEQKKDVTPAQLFAQEVAAHWNTCSVLPTPQNEDAWIKEQMKLVEQYSYSFWRLIVMVVIIVPPKSSQIIVPFQECGYTYGRNLLIPSF